MFTRLLKIRTVVLDSRADMGVRVGLTNLSSSEQSHKTINIVNFTNEKVQNKKIIVKL